MDDSIRRKIVLHESDMDLDLQWSKLESRLQEKKRRGFVFYFLTFLVGAGILTSGLYLILPGLEKNKTVQQQNTAIVNTINNEDNTNHDKVNSFTRNIVQIKQGNTSNTHSSEVNNNSGEKHENNNSAFNTGSNFSIKNFKTESLKNKSASFQKINHNSSDKNIAFEDNDQNLSKNIIKDSEQPVINLKREDDPAKIAGLNPKIEQKLPEYMMEYDNNRIQPVKNSLPVLTGWLIDIGLAGNVKSDAVITTENSTDQNSLTRKSLEVLNYQLGLRKLLGKNISIGAGYERQVLYEKFSSAGTGYYIKPLNNALIASGPDNQNRVYGTANAVTEVKYNIVSYNKHNFDWIYLSPAYHLQLKQYEVNLGATYFYNINSSYRFTNVSEAGDKIISSQKGDDLRKYSIQLGLSRNVFKNLQAGISASYFLSDWQYDLNNPTFAEPNILLQSTGINNYKLNSFNVGLNLKYRIN